MYWLVETESQLQRFYNSGYKEAYLEIVGCDLHDHPAENSVCLVYVRPLQSEKGFVLPISHTECFTLNQDDVFKFLSKFTTLYVSDLKHTYHYFRSSNLRSCNWGQAPIESSQTKTHKIFQKRYPKVKNLNRIIPVVKHYELLQNNYSKVKIEKSSRYGEYFDKRSSVVYYNIERSGIGINKDLFFEYFHLRDKPIVYSQYNLNTSTTRPSNKFGGVNYAALNKKNGERKSFVATNDYFVEFDVKAYHPVIVSHLLNYEFDDPDIHSSFAKMYGTSRERAKEVTFQQFYGKIFAKYKELTYFKLLLRKQEELFSQYQTQGFLEEPMSSYRFFKDKLGEITKEKLFNYFLQATESAYNVEILEKVHEILQGSQTKIVLTVYDSFLFDVKSGEEHLLKKIHQVFVNKKLNTSIKSGYDYDFT